MQSDLTSFDCVDKKQEVDFPILILENKSQLIVVGNSFMIVSEKKWFPRVEISSTVYIPVYVHSNTLKDQMFL